MASRYTLTLTMKDGFKYSLVLPTVEGVTIASGLHLSFSTFPPVMTVALDAASMQASSVAPL